MDHAIFTELSLVIVLTAVVALVMRLLRQPLILGYIITGILAGPALFGMIHSRDAFEGFSTIGIALLLFIIGLGMNISVIGKVGKSIFITAGALLVTIGSIGFLAGQLLLGFGLKESYIVGLALFFSSTIIIVKVLADKKEQNRLHGQIAIGVILLDDIIATLALLFVAAASKNESFDLSTFGELFGRGALLIGFLILASHYVLPRIAKWIANSQENLFLFAIAWGFGVASLFQYVGFSIEVGALFAGVALGGLPYAQEIESRLKPLRDFFIVLFFITLGEGLNITNLGPAIAPALLLSFIVIVLKPAVVTTALGLLGYPKRVAFKAGINLSQVSEFSIVLIVLAVSAGLVRPELSAIMTIIAMVTITTSTYLMKYDDELFVVFDKLKIFAPIFIRGTKTERVRKNNYELLLFGYHRGGHEFIHTFDKLKKSYMVVDYDPGVIELLQQRQIPCQYGDATDAELLEEVGVASAKLIVSTITDTETNQELVRHINFYNPDAVIVCNANSYEEALQLYELGCSYVMIPHFAGSERLSSLIHRNGIDRRHFDRYRAKHLEHLEKNHPLTLAEDAL